MKGGNILDTLYILLILIVAFIIYYGYTFLRQRKIVKTLTEEQFREGYRKAQLIDVREPNEFDNGHILGARNIPMTTDENAIAGNSSGQACIFILPKRNEKRSYCTTPVQKRL